MMSTPVKWFYTGEEELQGSKNATSTSYTHLHVTSGACIIKQVY